ncbi:hypothetical protein KIH79_10735 [Bifidobacterium sp. 82T10]|uniref:Uncharacterized protein n=1 Tax=Bifidobacterium miconis TaxID=2834435 RepID=A0ABS6WH52_9BIFI|nr:hypothetical protein [Bifidobacterium miconis]MBW3093386.1 hypothetical protein [Bifidobacterium miconis]
MTASNSSSRQARRRWAADCGQLDLTGSQFDHALTLLNTIRDRGASEDVLEDLTLAIGHLRQARRAVSDASRHLWPLTGEDSWHA